MNKVIIEPQARKVELEKIRIESNYVYLHPGHVADQPKERE